MNHKEKTPYETEPVENLSEAMRAFVSAYDRLHEILKFNGYNDFDKDLKATMYKPVKPDIGSTTPPISLYEIGVSHFPDDRTEAGRHSIHDEKFAEALKHKSKAIRALLVQEEAGVLPRLCLMITEFINLERTEEELLPEHVYAALMRFLNECRRLTAMWI